MPGLESQDTTIGRIDPATLIGRPDRDIVSPRATAALGNAFREGFITADDVLARVGELGKSKEKAQIAINQAQTMQAGEQMSPQAQAARAAQLAASGAQGTLGAAQANAAMQNVDPAAALQAKEIELKQALADFPAVAYFQKFAPSAGIAAPVTSDGKPDYRQMEKIGAEMAVWQSEKTDAQAFLDNVEDHQSFDEQGREVTSSWTKQGDPVDPRVIAEKRKLATRPFTRSNTSVKAAFGAPGVSSTFSGEAGAAITAAQNAALIVEPRATATAIAPKVNVMPAAPTGNLTIGTPASGGYISGAAKQVPVKPEDAAAAAMKLAAAQAQIPIIAGAKAAVARGTGVGPLEGSTPMQWGNRLGAAIGLDASTAAFNDQRTLEQAISAKILEGAQVMKGNLSDKDVRFLQATVPQLSDSEAVWNTYLDRWAAMNQSNIDILSGKTPRDLSVDRFAPKDWVDPATVKQGPPASAATPTVKTAAEAAALPPTVQFFLTPDGRTKKNPNYRP